VTISLLTEYEVVLTWHNLLVCNFLFKYVPCW